MKSWSDAKKKLEQDFLAPSLRGRVSYFMTRYTHAHDEAGRVAIRVDGKELFQSCDLKDRWFPYPVLREEARRRFPGFDALPYETRWRIEGNLEVDFGVIPRALFYDTYDRYENQSVEESLSGENALIRLFAILDRRVGKRRLRALWDAGWGEPAWLLPFFCLRLEAEGILPEPQMTE